MAMTIDGAVPQSFWEVHITLLSVYTLLIPVINYAIIFFFVATLQKSDGSREQEASKHGIRWAFYGTMLFMADVVVVTLLLIWAAGYDSYIVINFARGLSVVTIIGTLTQFLPQIYTTFRCKVSEPSESESSHTFHDTNTRISCAQTGGDLSLLMLCIQAPGSGAIAILQGVVYGMPPAVWVPYVISMSQMAVLGGQIVYYDYIINPKKQEQQIEIPDTFQHLNIQDGSTPGLPIWKEE